MSLSPFEHSLLRFAFFEEEPELPPAKQLLTLADKHFNKGVQFFSKNKFQDAIDEFKLCIALDPNDVDACYDLGYAYQKNGNNDLSCKIWKQLSDMGQKGGEEIYKMQCKWCLEFNKRPVRF